MCVILSHVMLDSDLPCHGDGRQVSGVGRRNHQQRFEAAGADASDLHILRIPEPRGQQHHHGWLGESSGEGKVLPVALTCGEE